ncbi:potassium channel family protein [Photobacterium sp. DNB23_23_1]|uniref:Potassium channel family protein n=1 Tax=Photobacterium pectinilyticum TaxID=2906793 RepID=A0ABT1N1Y0_9GAMM|nr:potassium channel family protein [Photobacterium sp. ZSDE20]MCQ1058745.1 potassium channel family protein [Photobacterium sp. ZSDE20]MDD1823527.1 potassium channel family protein [Photobacterium sp. ZSDE20]
MGKKITEKNNFYYLTTALILLLVSSSLDQVLHITWLDKIMQGITLLTFAVCLMSLRFDSGWYRFLLSLAVVWIGLVIVKELFDFKQTDVAMLVLMLSFFFGTFKSIMRQILFTGSIDNNKVVGSLALFLLLGLMWAITYLLILEFSPESFTGLEAKDWGDNFSNAAYFSFVTLTTLGYGDISPISPFAQVIVYLEATAGVFYMAIVVASLVGASQNSQENNDG